MSCSVLNSVWNKEELPCVLLIYYNIIITEMPMLDFMLIALDLPTIELSILSLYICLEMLLNFERNKLSIKNT